MSYFTHRTDIPDPLKRAGIECSDQHEARLHWLEREVAFLADYIEAVEGRLLIKIVRKLPPNRPDTEPGETDHA